MSVQENQECNKKVCKYSNKGVSKVLSFVENLVEKRKKVLFDTKKFGGIKAFFKNFLSCFDPLQFHTTRFSEIL